MDGGLICVLVVVLGGGALAWIYLAGRQANARVEAVMDILRPHYEYGKEGLFEDWHFDLQNMTAGWKLFSMDSPLEREEHYHLRRRDGPRWQIKLTSESCQKIAAEIRVEWARPATTVADDVVRAGTTEAQEQAALEERRKKWKSLPDVVAARLETDYQRFLALHRR